MTLLTTQPDAAPRPLPHPHRRTAAVDKWRLRHAAMCVLFAAFCLNSSAGRLTPDTKTDLVVDPGRFLSRAVHLWDAQGFAGELQNQAYGYLFPMGPFFWVLHSVGVPGWVAQRLWWATLMSVAFLGVVRLARLLRFGTPLSRMIAGTAYACSPHVLTVLNANSVEVLPMCVAPWIVVALARGAEAGGSPRRAGLLCGAAVLCMGGVNATADLAALLPALLFLLTRARGPRRRSLLGWAVGGTVLATLWWVVPLLLLGRYSPPFLDYIEDARTTTGVTSLAETLRGTADWVAYLPSDGWHAGLLLLTKPTLIVASVVVAALGLAGVAASRSMHRSWLVACLAVGLVAVTFGHVSDVGPLLAGHERSLLDTTLVPLRNVHKFDVLIRLPLVLGLAELLPRVAWGRTGTERRNTALFGRAVAVAAVLVTALPMVTLELANSSTVASVPGYWSRTASWLGAHAGNGRTLLVPASITPTYAWGTLTDEPLQSLATSPWEVRSNVPLTTPGHIRMLDAVENLLATGVEQPDLAGYLSRNGIRYLVARNDLDYRTVGALSPGVVRATLASSPGLREVASFGPTVGGDLGYPALVDQLLQPTQHAVEIWRVAGTGDPRITTAAASSLTQVSGGPESVLQLAQASGRPVPPTVSTGSTTGGVTPGRTVLTDDLRRREVNYGGASGQHSTTLTAADDGLIGRHVLDYLPVTGESHQSVVRYLGARSLTASSSGADADGFFAVRPDEQPWSAFDGDPTTAWRSAPGVLPVGQWIELTLPQARRLPTLTVTLPAPSPVTRLTVTTSSGARTVPVGRDGRVRVTVPGAATTVLRLSVSGVVAGYDGQVGITGIAAPGLHVSRTVVAPDDLPANRAVDEISFATPDDARTGCLLTAGVPHCVAGRYQAGEDGAALDRTFTLPRAGSYAPSLSVAARPGTALTNLLARAAEPSITASASSDAVPDPLAGAQSLVDGSLATGWVADPDDPDPTVTLVLPRAVRLSSLSLRFGSGLAATRPDLLRLTSAAGTRTVAIGSDGTARFAALTTNRVVLHLSSAHGLRASFGSSVPGQITVGIGLSEIVVPGVRATVAPASRPVTLPCGEGPEIDLDGTVVQTRVSTTLGALRDLTRIPAVVCGDATTDIAAGTHRMVAGASTGLWDVRQVQLTRSTPATAAARAASTDVAARVTHWTDTARSVAVAARTTPQLLIVDENVNPGWRATLDGHVLQRLTVDGWRQGYVVPAGARGTVSLNFTPQRVFGGALVVGLVAVVLLVVLLGLGLPRRRLTELPALDGRRRATPVRRAVGGVVLCALLGGGVGAAAGAVTVVVLLVAVRLARRRSWAPFIVPGTAGAALLLAGTVLAARHYGRYDYAADTAQLQVICLVAVAAAAIGRATTEEQQ